MDDRGASSRRRAAFTLVEVLAALLMMAIIVPVAIEGMSVASRVAVLGQRKAAAMRVGERVLSELLVETQIQQASSSGTAYEGDVQLLKEKHHFSQRVHRGDFHQEPLGLADAVSCPGSLSACL